MKLMATTLEELAYELAQRALSQQESVLGELRMRTGTLLTATALVTSFLGARSLDPGANRSFAAFGLSLAVMSIVFCVSVLAPRSSFDFALSAPTAYEALVEKGADMDEAHRTLAYWIQGAWNANQDSIDRLVRMFQLACVALVLAIGFLSLGLAVH
jgi:hypothetical protein